MPRLRRGIVCQQAVELVTAYIEGTLSTGQHRRFEAHLSDCEHCREYLAQMRVTLQRSGTINEEDLDPEMRDDFISLYRQWRSET